MEDFRRLRRLRQGSLIRNAVADVRLSLDDLIMPIFVRDGQEMCRPISSMPGVSQFSPDLALREIERMAEKGIGKFLLFGVVERSDKDASGSIAWSEKNPVCQLMRTVREKGTDVLLISDLCFCEYTDHGHCGELCEDPRLTVHNDSTLDNLARQAVAHAQMGADIIAPSGMMDGTVGAVRSALDESGLSHVAIMNYTVKYASSFYGPFREAAEGAPQFGDRRGYQMDYRRSREWLLELDADHLEGADMVMVKPALAYLDIIHRVREQTALPVVAYNISGEYSMVHAAAERGWIDLKAAALEMTTAIKRAGADLIISYFSPMLADWI